VTTGIWAKWGGILGMGALVMATGLVGQARATDDTGPQAVPAAPTAPAAGPQADVKGFRSADFGMTEAEVRAAIGRDFGIHGSAIHSSANAIEQTHILQVTVPDLIPKGGVASVAYVFGYQSKRLFHVQVVWSKDKDPSLTPQQLLTNGQLLTNYFTAAGYQPQTVATNVVTKAGIILFRGVDGSDHGTVAMLHGSFGQTKDKRQIFVPTALTVDYILHPQKPDVFELQAGKF
jgi:hypothetical protein